MRAQTMPRPLLPQIEEPDISVDDLEDMIPADEVSLEDQDEAQATLQPAISAAASHLTSAQTPAAEKAAALERLPGGYFDNVIVEGEEFDDEGDASPRVEGGLKKMLALSGDGCASDSIPAQTPDQLPLPSPWTSGPKPFVIKEPARSRQSKSLLGSAFGPTRQHRSRSAGQEAFKKLQRAFPSLSGHTNLFPSLPTSFFSNLSGDRKSNSNSSLKPRSSTSSGAITPARQQVPANGYLPAERLPGLKPHDRRTTLPEPLGIGSSSRSRPRPPMLRRVTSDESMLYHSLSRQSSLGDDAKFNDVREMVNIRLMAIKDSLPEVPNFRMPSLAKFQVPTRMSSISLNGLFSSSSDGDEANKHVSGDGPETPATANSGSNRPRVTLTPDDVLDELVGDLVVLGGYRGSVLRSAEPPHQQLWAPVKLGFNMRKADLEVGLEDEDEETMEERIIPSGMLKHIGPVDISRKLFKKLQASANAKSGKLRIWDFGYDWRLSPASTSKKLQDYLAKLPCNQPGTPPEARGAIVIAHSLGGLITRHAVNKQPHLFAGVLYAGVPQRCINILGPFRNGDTVLFNEKLLTAQVNFSIRTSFVLLPEDGFCFIDKETGESYPVDFFKAEDWVKWHLSPCVAPLLPPYGREKQQGLSSPLSSLFTSSLLSKTKKPMEPDIQSGNSVTAGEAPLPSPPGSPSTQPSFPGATASDRERYMEYLGRVLAATKAFRSELAHSREHEASNAYPPHAVLYGKTIPTVYAAQVASRAAIPYADAYDDLLFRPGDGVVLAREAMLPDGYAIVRSGRVSTERGHLTMLGDLPAVAQALEALLRGRRKGIGLGK